MDSFTKPTLYSSQAKHIQFVSGVGATSYWIGTFLFDVVNALVPSILILITFAAFNVKGLRDENLAVVFILFVSFKILISSSYCNSLGHYYMYYTVICFIFAYKNFRQRMHQ